MPTKSKTTSKKMRPVKLGGDPKGARPSDRRRGFTLDDEMSEHRLANGRTVRGIWLPTTRTHVHIIIWDLSGESAPIVTPRHVARLQATRLTNELLAQLEAQ